MAHDPNQFGANALRNAISRGDVVSLSMGETNLTLPGRFQAATDAGVRILVSGSTARAGQTMSASFLGGSRRLDFSSKLLAVEPEAVLIAWPEQIVAEQRRNAFRVLVEDTDRIEIRVWCIDDKVLLSAKPAPSLEFRVKLRDLSTGGAGLLFMPWEKHANRIEPNQRLRLQISRGDDTGLVDARVRTANPIDIKQPTAVGVVFKRLDAEIEGRRAFALLTRLVGELQAVAVKKARLEQVA